MNAMTAVLWVKGRQFYTIKVDREMIDLLEASVEVHKECVRAVSKMLENFVVGELDPADRDALIDAIIVRFGSSKVMAYA